jgi:hypothetical protein
MKWKKDNNLPSLSGPPADSMTPTAASAAGVLHGPTMSVAAESRSTRKDCSIGSCSAPSDDSLSCSDDIIGMQLLPSVPRYEPPTAASSFTTRNGTAVDGCSTFQQTNFAAAPMMTTAAHVGTAAMTVRM